MRCNCLDGKIGRSDLPEEEETCWRCRGTGTRLVLWREDFGTNKDGGPNKYSLSDQHVESTPLFREVRNHLEHHKEAYVSLEYVDGAECFTLHCPGDTNGDGDCGRPGCRLCHPENFNKSR